VDLAHDAEGMAGKLDELVAPAPEPENAVLVHNALVVRWAGPAFARDLHIHCCLTTGHPS
jgi:hypothetical protein